MKFYEKKKFDPSNIEVCTTWKTLDVVITIEDWDYTHPDEFMPNSGYVEIDYVPEGNDSPLDRIVTMIQAQMDDEPQRYFDKVIDSAQDEIYEAGLIEYVERTASAAEAYYEDEDYRGYR